MQISFQFLFYFTIFTLLAVVILYILKFFKFKNLTDQKNHLHQENQQLINELIRIKTENELLQKNISDQEQNAQNLKDSFSDIFKGLAADALTQNNESFLQMARNSIEKESLKNQSHLEKNFQSFNEIVSPLKDTLKEYKDQVRHLEINREKSYSLVESELKKINEINVNLTKETAALKNALKKPHVRGRWGEVQLKNCIELAGMSEFADVSFQESTTTSDGKRYIPDMSVKMPGNKYIYVDAKTPIDAFLQSLESNNEKDKEAQMLRHGQHVKNHIKQLSSKAYAQNLQDSADFTVMFLPNESFLYAALETQADLIDYALDKKILIATPPTLIGLLKVIRYGWNEQVLSENAKLISKAGTELHKRICDFVDAYTNVGKFLDKAQNEYHAGMTRLESRVLTQARRLEKLGAKSHKNLPEGLGQELEIIEEKAPDA